LPSLESIHPPEAAAIKSRIGRYTLHQHYRGKPSDPSSYDPLDLFSGNDAQVERALAGLWGIWRKEGGKANSFRVFVDGNVVHPDEVGPLTIAVDAR
jgi:inositol-pentakisphosphate 2-kinase